MIFATTGKASTPELKRQRKKGAWLATAGLLAVAAPVHTLSAQDDVQGQSVADRNAPEFTARPIQVGAFQVFPSIEFDVEYNDNIFAQQNAPIDDFIFSLRPNVLLVDRRPDSVTRINVNAGIRQYIDVGSEDAEQFGIRADTRQGIGTGTEFRAGVRVNRNNEQRRDIDAFGTVLTPISFTNLQANAGVTQDYGPLRLSVDARARGVEYDGFATINGTRFDLAFRDFQVYGGSVRLGFARSRDQEFYVQFSADTRNYELAPITTNFGNLLDFIDRSSDGGRLEAGYRQQITQLLYLDVRAGYFFRDFEDVAIGEVEGFAFQTDLLWNVSPLTSIKVSGIRQVDETINPLLSGLVRTEGVIQVEHEALRNLILSGRGSYARLDQTNSAFDGDQWSLAAYADYRLNRHWGLLLEAEYYERTGLFEFDQTTLALGIQYNF